MVPLTKPSEEGLENVAKLLFCSAFEPGREFFLHELEWDTEFLTPYGDALVCLFRSDFLIHQVDQDWVACICLCWRERCDRSVRTPYFYCHHHVAP